MDLLLGIITGLGWWAALGAVIFAYWLFLFAGLHEDGNATRDRWVGILRERNFEAHYRDSVLRGMDWLDRRLTPELLFDPEPKPLRTAFSFRLLSRALRLAFFYPILSLTLQWAISGADATMGGLLIIPAEDNRLIRAAAIGGLVFQVGLILLTRRAVLMRQTGLAVFGRLMLILAVASVFAVVLAPAVAFATAFAVLGWVAFVLAIAFAATLGIIVPEVTVTLTLALGVASAYLLSFVGLGRGVRMRFRFWLPIGMLAWVVIVVIGAPQIGQTVTGENGAGVILFIGFLPLLNGLLDFLSAGTTRFLIRYGGVKPWWWVADALAALTTLALLAAGFIAFVIFAVPQDGAPLLDLPQVFHDIRTKPVEYWWLSFMLFSTLLPTLLHFVAALSSIHTFTRKSWRLWIADEIEEQHDRARARRGKLALAFMNTVAWWAPVFVVIYLGLWVWTVDNGLRDVLVDVAEWLAMSLSDWRNGPGAYVPIPVGARGEPLTGVAF